MENNPMYTFTVQKLGSEAVSKSSNSITSLQKSLKKMYTLYQKNVSLNPPLPQFKIIAGVQGMTISDAYNIQPQTLGDKSEPTVLQSPQVLKDQVIMKAALQFKTIPADKKGKKFKGAFITLDQELLMKNKKEYSSLFANIDEKENFLATMNNPPLFVCVIKTNKNYDMHVFTCNNEAQALNIISVLNGSAPKFNNEAPINNTPNEIQNDLINNNPSVKDGTIPNENTPHASNAQQQSPIEQSNPINSNISNTYQPQALPNHQMMGNMSNMGNMGNNLYDTLPSTQQMPPFNPQPNPNQPNYPQMYGQPYMPPYYPPYGNPYPPQPIYGPSYVPQNFPPNPPNFPIPQYFNPPDNIYQQFSPQGSYPSNFNVNQTHNVTPQQEATEFMANQDKNQNQLKSTNLIPRPVIISQKNGTTEKIEDKFNNMNVKSINPQMQQHPSNFINPEPQFSPSIQNVYGGIPQTAPVGVPNQFFKDEAHNQVQQKLSGNVEGQQFSNVQQDQPLTAPVQKKSDKIPPLPPAKKPIINASAMNKPSTSNSTSSQSEEGMSPISPDLSEARVLKVPKKVMGIQVLPFPVGGLDRPKKQTPLQPPSSPPDVQPVVKTEIPEISEISDAKEITPEKKVESPELEVREPNGTENDFEKSLGYFP